MHLLKTGFGVLRSPLHGIEINRSPYSSQRSIEGLAYCGFFLTVYIVLRLFTGPKEGPSWWSYTLGGLAFVAVGIVAGAMFRKWIGKVTDVDWTDDALILGGALLFPATGLLVRALLFAPSIHILDGVGQAVYLACVLLAAFTYAGSLSRVGRVREEEGVLLTVLTLGVAQLVAATLGFALI
jgi:hypothetical protein